MRPHETATLSSLIHDDSSGSVKPFILAARIHAHAMKWAVKSMMSKIREMRRAVRVGPSAKKSSNRSTTSGSARTREENTIRSLQ